MGPGTSAPASCSTACCRTAAPWFPVLRRFSIPWVATADDRVSGSVTGRQSVGGIRHFAQFRQCRSSVAAGSGGHVYYAFTNRSGGNVTRLCFGRASTDRAGGRRHLHHDSAAAAATARRGHSWRIDTSGVVYAAAGRYLYQLNPGGSPVLVYTAPATHRRAQPDAGAAISMMVTKIQSRRARPVAPPVRVGHGDADWRAPRPAPAARRGSMARSIRRR